MAFHMHYQLKQHYKFEKGSRKYITDLETNDIIQVNDVEWEILDRYETQPKYQIVEGLKEKYKIASIFNGIERLERLGQQGSLLSPIDESSDQTANNWKQENRKPKLLVPFHFTKEKTSLDYHGNWRFNLRESNTEPLLRLNVETIGDKNLLIGQTMKISEKLESLGGKRETRFRWEPEW